MRYENWQRLIVNEGFIDMIKYAYEKEHEWDENLCRYAAESNNLEILIYAHKNGCHIDEMVCSYAV